MRVARLLPSAFRPSAWFLVLGVVLLGAVSFAGSGHAQLIGVNLYIASCATVSPQTVELGQPVQVSGLVIGNSGSSLSGSGPFRVGVYEIRPRLDPLYLGGFDVASIGPRRTIQIPPISVTLTGVGVHRFRIVLDPANEVAESSEGDNACDVDVTVTVVPPPSDLTYFAPATAPTDPKFVNEPFDVIVPVTNQGEGNAGAFDVAVGVFRVDVLGRELKAAIGTTRVNAGLAAGAQIEVTVSCVLEKAGRYTLTFLIDSALEIDESDEENNQSFVAGYQYVDDPLPDLRPGSKLSVDPELNFHGSPYVLAFDVENVGERVLRPFPVVLQRLEGVIRPIWVDVDTRSVLSPFSQGESRTVTFEGVWDLTGEHVLRVRIDPDDVVQELDEANNTSESFRVAVHDAPELRAVELPEVSPDILPVGDYVDVSQWMIGNVGSRIAKRFEVGYYLVAEGTDPSWTTPLYVAGPFSLAARTQLVLPAMRFEVGKEFQQGRYDLVLWIDHRGTVADEVDPSDNQIIDPLLSVFVPVLVESFGADLDADGARLQWSLHGVGAPTALRIRRLVDGDGDVVVHEQDLDPRVTSGEAVDRLLDVATGRIVVYALELAWDGAWTILANTGPFDVPARGPTRTRLLSCVPNPFNPITSVVFALEHASEVTLRVVDVSGRTVCILAQASWPAGIHAVPWKGTDDRGRPVASGVYLAVLEAGGTNSSTRMCLLR